MQNVHKKKSPVFVVNPQIIIDELPYLEINAGGQLVLYAGGEEGVGGRFLPLPAPGHAHQLLFVSSVADPNPVGPHFLALRSGSSNYMQNEKKSNS